MGVKTRSSPGHSCGCQVLVHWCQAHGCRDLLTGPWMLRAGQVSSAHCGCPPMLALNRSSGLQAVLATHLPASNYFGNFHAVLAIHLLISVWSSTAQANSSIPKPSDWSSTVQANRLTPKPPHLRMDPGEARAISAGRGIQNSMCTAYITKPWHSDAFVGRQGRREPE
eukprot:scaffold152556_cov18-Tisochrysis_lutea.AAC.1